jgi:hypothetical protein
MPAAGAELGAKLLDLHGEGDDLREHLRGGVGCGPAGLGVVRHGEVRRAKARWSMVWSDVIRCGVVRFDGARQGLLGNGVTGYGTVR